MSGHLPALLLHLLAVAEAKLVVLDEADLVLSRLDRRTKISWSLIILVSCAHCNEHN